MVRVRMRIGLRIWKGWRLKGRKLLLWRLSLGLGLGVGLGGRGLWLGLGRGLRLLQLLLWLQVVGSPVA